MTFSLYVWCWLQGSLLNGASTSWWLFYDKIVDCNESIESNVKSF